MLSSKIVMQHAAASTETSACSDEELTNSSSARAQALLRWRTAQRTGTWNATADHDVCRIANENVQQLSSNEDDTSSEDEDSATPK